MGKVRLLCICFCTFSAGAGPHRDWDAIRHQVASILQVADSPYNPQAKFYGRFTPAPGVDADRVSYATAYGLRVPAIVYHPAGATIVQHPALVIVNGHGGDKSSWYSYWAGILYARAGAVVLTYDPIGEYERNRDRRSNTSQHDEVIPPDEMARRLAGLMVSDVIQSVAYLDTRQDVDPKRIGVLGYSMGSFITSLACAIDAKMHVCVLAGGGDLDGPAGYWDNSRKMCQGIPYQSLQPIGDRGAIIFALHAKRGPTLIWNGSADEVVDIPHHGEEFFADLRKRTISELRSSKDVFDYGFMPGGGHRPYFLTRPVAAWLQDKLKFPEWTKKTVASLPETHVLGWAAENHITVPKSLANDHGEGGTMALGTDIRPVPRDDLHALPEAVWNSERENYIYETWLGRAEAAVRNGAP